MAVREAAVGSTAVEVIRAPAKLTISLRVVGVRPDGYHLIIAPSGNGATLVFRRNGAVVVDLFSEEQVERVVFAH